MPTTAIQQFPYPVSTDSADVPRDLKALADALDVKGHVPVGAMFMWPAATAPVENDVGGNPLWLLMLGQVVLATTYPKLATVLGSAAGNVTVPDMRTVFPVGSGAGYPLLQGGGAASVTLLANQSGMRAHNHGGATAASDRSLAHAHPLNNGQVSIGITPAVGNGGFMGLLNQPGGIGWWAGDTIASGAAGAPDHLHAIAAEAAANGIDAHENRPPFKAVNFIIRAG